MCDKSSIASGQAESPDTGGAVMQMWVGVPRSMKDAVLEVDFAPASCGFDRFVDPYAAAMDWVSDKVVAVDLGTLTEIDAGGYGASHPLTGVLPSGAEAYVHFSVTVNPAPVSDPPFVPETGEPTPEPEPTPEVIPEPEPTPESPAVPDVPEPEEPVSPPAVPEVPEVPVELPPPAVDEPVEPFFPDTGIEARESSVPVLGWLLGGIGLTVGIGTCILARRWS